MRRLAVFATVAALVAAFALPSTASGAQWRTAKNVPRWLTGGSVTLTYTDRDGDGQLSWNDDVVYSVTPNTALTNWYVMATCSQSGTVVLQGGGIVRYGVGSDWIRLDSWAWADATSASCTFSVASLDGLTAYIWWSSSASVAA